jgi:acyl-coenzyme A synthetase/AMP-(fatty) acid ligase/aryl carrier-like protein
VVNLVTADERLAVRPGDVVAHLAPTAFDASTFEIWSALTAGATVAVVTESRVGTTELGAMLREVEPDWMFLTTGLFHLLVEHDPDALRNVGVLIAGGDVLSPRHVATAAALVRKQLFAAYGPTEGTVFSSLHAVDPEAGHDRVPLGRPVTGKRMSIAAADGTAVPDGEPGEIWLGGVGVARGYHGLPELTAQRFVEDGEHGRRYRTGDRGRVLPGGEFEFLGRLDRQLKVRGFRVEPEEIELTLQAHPRVRAAAVVLITEEGMQRLVACVSLRPDDDQAGHGVTGTDLRSWLVQRLPAHLHPNNVVILDELPLGPNGKLDRAALPSTWRHRADLHAAALPPYIEPVTEVELLAAGIFQDALQIDTVGVHDSFFDLGGDSLRSAAALRQLSAATVPITARQFYREPTVAAVAKFIETS